MFERTRKKQKPINLLAMINLIFLMLVFFLVAGRVERPDPIEVEVPVAQSGQMLDKGELEILLGMHDEIIVEDGLIGLEQVEPMVDQFLAQNPEAIVTVKADARLEAKRMIHVLQAVQRAGAANVSIITQSGSGAS